MKLFVDSNIIIEGLKLKGLKEAGEILKFISVERGFEQIKATNF